MQNSYSTMNTPNPPKCGTIPLTKNQLETHRKITYKQGYKKNTQGSRKEGKRRDDQNLCPQRGDLEEKGDYRSKDLGCPRPGVQQREDKPFSWLEDRWD